MTVRTYSGEIPPAEGYKTWHVLLAPDGEVVRVVARDAEIFTGFVRFDGPLPLFVFKPHVMSLQLLDEPEGAVTPP